MSDERTGGAEGGRRPRKGRWFLLFALAVAAAAFGRQIAIGAADRRFEERLRELDEE